MLSEFQAEIPDPLAQDLPELLPARGMRAPAIGILLEVFIGQNRFARTRDADINLAHLWRKKPEQPVW
jgi:hypothetical protein